MTLRAFYNELFIFYLLYYLFWYICTALTILLLMCQCHIMSIKINQSINQWVAIIVNNGQMVPIDSTIFFSLPYPLPHQLPLSPFPCRPFGQRPRRGRWPMLSHIWGIFLLLLLLLRPPPSDPNPSLKPNPSLEFQIPALRLKFLPWSQNPSLKAQIWGKKYYGRNSVTGLS